MRLGEVESAVVKLGVQDAGRNQYVWGAAHGIGRCDGGDQRWCDAVDEHVPALELMRLDLDRHSNPSYVGGGSSPFFRATCSI